MQRLTPQAEREVASLAQRYGVSTDAVATLLDAVARGGGSMAQFNHPDLGGYGQWMRGGMIMLGDMFNNGLKATVDGLCNELLRLLDTNPFVPAPSYGSQNSGGFGQSGNFWPPELGQPNSAGSQNDMRYAYFAGSRRLAIQEHGAVTVYDTLDHQIGGVSQQQGSGYSVAFTSQYGSVNLSQLPVVWSSTGGAQPMPNAPSAPLPTASSSNNVTSPTNMDSFSSGSSTSTGSSMSSGSSGSSSEDDIFAKIERLAALRDKGILSEQEFLAKKAELLQRI